MLGVVNWRVRKLVQCFFLPCVELLWRKTQQDCITPEVMKCPWIYQQLHATTESGNKVIDKSSFSVVSNKVFRRKLYFLPFGDRLNGLFHVYNSKQLIQLSFRFISHVVRFQSFVWFKLVQQLPSYNNICPG